MNILYQQNPLNTIIDLDESDIEKLRLNVHIRELEGIIHLARFYLKDKSRNFSVKETQDRLDEIDSIDGTVDHTLKYLLESATEGHIGDCTCFPASCTKCMLEDFLGIDTLEYSTLGKHGFSTINEVFYTLGDNTTCTQAIDYLKNNPLTKDSPNNWTDQEAWAKCVPRFNKEREQAVKYLENYRYKHLGGL